MDQTSLAEKLSLQVESFQEGFEILSGSLNFKEMAINLAHLIKGNFLIKDIFLFYKISKGAEWECIKPENYNEGKELDFNISDKIDINYCINKKYAASVVLPLSDNSYLGILVGNKLDGTGFNEFEKISLQILLQVFDNAYKSFLNQKKEKELIFNLNERVSQLNNLIDTGIEISKYELQNSLYEFAVERGSSLTNSASAFIRIKGNDQNGYEKYYTFPDSIKPEEILQSTLKIESSFSYKDKTYQMILSGKETRKGLTSFTELDQLLLDAIMKQLSAAIENEFLLGQELEKERIEQELNIAASIQQRIIPKEISGIKGYDIAGINIPSKEVGGDYYDCIKTNKGETALVIADVAGKGISAALLVNTLHAALYTYLEFNAPLPEIFNKLNTLIYNSSPSDKYITCFVALLNPETGSLDVINAGHNPILLIKKDNTIQKINAGGTGLGMLDFGIPFLGENQVMNSGDKLFLYTDGIPEAMNENEEEYSEERMISFLKNHSEMSAEEFINALVKDVKAFVKTAHQSDDITALFLKKI